MNSLIDDKVYYVYALCDPRSNNTPFYIGKGKGRRIRMHLNSTKTKKTNSRKYQIIMDIISSGNSVTMEILEHGLLEHQAYQIETDLILHLGRASRDNFGILTNITTHRCPLSGWSHTAETRAKMSKRQPKKFGEENNFFGRTHTPETREILRNKNMGRNNGVPKSNTTKDRMAKSWGEVDSPRRTAMAVRASNRNSDPEFSQRVALSMLRNKIRKNLTMFGEIITHLQNGKNRREIEALIGVSYHKITPVMQNIDRYTRLYQELLNDQ